MPIVIHPSSPAIATITNTSSTVTTASFTPPVGSQLWVASIGNQDSASGSWAVASTPSLGAFTQAVLTNTQQAPAAWHYNTVTTSQSYTVTSTRSGGVANNNGSTVMCFVITGAEATPGGQTATANSNSGTPSQTITTTRQNSLILACLGDWAQRGAGTAGTGQTILGEHDLSTEYTSHVWRYNGLPGVGTYTINLTAPTLEDYNLSIVEIRASTARDVRTVPTRPWRMR